MLMFRAAFSVTAILGILPLSAAAQDLSAEEILSRLQAQRDVFAQAGSGDALGGTRGLQLITVDGGTPPVSAAEGTVTARTQTDPVETDMPQPVVFAQLGADLQVNLQISFAFDSAAIEPSEAPTLDKMCQVIAGSDLERIRIVGHTDSSGSDTYNERLSILRAREVARYFVDKCGIAAGRLETTGMGERFPLDRANPRADENRRVEFQALS